ncbi:MAG: dTDP-4-dehydrorhamnose 3,5-epimerase family protein, partial [Pseudomonadales bacterium]
VTTHSNVLRGLHLQLPPSTEGKLVRCVKGHVYDVIVDVRPDSPSYLRHLGIDLRGEEGTALFVPSGCAHGFVTLEPDCHVLYEMTDFYRPELGRGFRWNDPAFAIEWPVANPDGHERDLTYPDFDPDLVRAFEGRA